MFCVKITRHLRSKSNNWFGFIQSALNEWILLTSILRIRFLKVITTIILGLRVEYYTRILLQYNRYDDVMCYSTVCDEVKFVAIMFLVYIAYSGGDIKT